MNDFPFSPAVDHLIDLALTEDLCCGDLTSDSLFSADSTTRGVLLAKEPMVIAGLGVFHRVYFKLDDRVEIVPKAADSDHVPSGTGIATLNGPTRSVLRGERVALNFIRHLSGVATTTAHYVELLGTDGPRIVDTRKTTPGFRELEKYAVRQGGGFNHRFNLGAAVMIKDNHIAAVGSITEAVHTCRAAIPHTATIEVEITSLDMLEEALTAGADIIMLDNMSDEQMAEAVSRCAGRVITEASGGITDERLGALRKVGVDVISSGALTHSSRAADLSLDLEVGSS